ncbi:MAG: hypothetical protein M3068_05545 [Gemmatimonadota bacterium]|nr:hypothetical protein [Gemmatimonadota bacterium]
MESWRPYSLIAVALAAACGGSGSSAAACAAPGDSLVSEGVSEYVRDSLVTPQPLRFLAPVGSDSALPEAGRVALQDKGPTYLYPADPTQQALVRAMLKGKGDFPTLAVFYRGVSLRPDGRAQLRLHGRFVGGANDGAPAPSRAILFKCDSARWRPAGAAPDQGP